MFTQDFIDDLVSKSIIRSKEYIEDNNMDNAELLLRQALRVAPENINILELIGLVYVNKHLPDRAIEHYTKLLELDNNNYEAINNLSLCWSSVGKVKEAIELLNRGLELYPEKPSLWWNLALQHQQAGEIQKADDIYEAAITKIPNDVELHYNYGAFLGEIGRHKESIDQYEIALTLNPEHAMSRWNRALTDLLLGKYLRGFTGYEARWKAMPFYQKIRDRFKDKPEWDGKQKGRLLVYNEQGYGDLIQNIRFVSALKKMGMTVIVEVPPPMIDLISQCKDIDRVIAWKEEVDYDYHVSVNSLPHKFKLDLGYDVPPYLPYIKPTGEVPEDCFKDYANFLKIGICWAGNPQHSQDRERSCYLKEFKGLHDIAGVKLFSLQKETGKRFWRGKGVVDLTENCDDLSIVDMSSVMLNFNYTAAIMEKMDLIITVDTVIAHLAGALNKPCWLALPAHNDWRWGTHSFSPPRLEGTIVGGWMKRDSFKVPWYPSIRAFRKTRGGEWNEVFDSMCDCVRNYLG